MEWRLLPSPSHPSPFPLLEGGGEVLLDALIMDEFHPTVSGQLLYPPAISTVLHVAPALQVLCRNTTAPRWPPRPCDGVGGLALAPIVEGGRTWSLNVGQRVVEVNGEHFLVFSRISSRSREGLPRDLSCPRFPGMKGPPGRADPPPTNLTQGARQKDNTTVCIGDTLCWAQHQALYLIYRSKQAGLVTAHCIEGEAELPRPG